ncbi:MAG: hypothetical protein Q7K43_00270, partial [Candidatus Woesearchaeota archaeon]|nr:hypothetical protein [Candidatus Woesearchaeota archaeon]
LVPGRGVKQAVFVATGAPTKTAIASLGIGVSTGTIDIQIFPVDNIKSGEPLVFDVVIKTNDVSQSFKIVAAFDPAQTVPSAVSSVSSGSAGSSSSATSAGSGATAPVSVISGDSTPVRPLIVGSVCGNGVVDAGEVCDTNELTGQILLPSETAKAFIKLSPNEFSMVHVLTDIGSGSKSTFAIQSAKEFCAKLAGDCKTSAVGSQGQCSSDCKKFKPLLSCSIAEGTLNFLGFFRSAPGFSNWYGPEFVADKDKGIVVSSPNKFTYVGSDEKEGNNDCLGGNSRAKGDEVSIS